MRHLFIVCAALSISGILLLTGCNRGPKEGQLSGSFMRSDTSDHEGIRVFLPGTPYQASTDRLGRFHIPAIMPGDYELVVREEGYETIRESIQIASGAHIDLPSQTLTAPPPKTGSIRGKILLEDKETHENTMALLAGTPHSTQTDSDGEVVFNDVELGRYQLIVVRDGYHKRQ